MLTVDMYPPRYIIEHADAAPMMIRDMINTRERRRSTGVDNCYQLCPGNGTWFITLCGPTVTRGR